MQFLQAMQLCVEAIGLMPRLTRVEPLYGAATSHSSIPAYPATEQLALGNRLLKIASWIHVQAYDKAAKANVWMPDGVVQPILIG